MDNYNVTQPQVYTPQPQTTAHTTQQASPTAAGVNIIIQNPTVNPANSMPCYPSNYYTQSPIYNVAPPNAYQQTTAATPVTQEQQPVPAAPVKKDEEKTEEKKNEKTKEVVKLTDDYIKTLENYLRSSDRTVRQMGAKELVKRFEEDDSRKNDAALNSLLNLALQDPAGEIRLMALSVLGGGKAQGDDKTVQLLKTMQNSKDTYGQDALSATEALLAMSGEKVKIPDNSPDKPKKSDDESK